MTITESEVSRLTHPDWCQTDKFADWQYPADRAVLHQTEPVRWTTTGGGQIAAHLRWYEFVGTDQSDPDTPEIVVHSPLGMKIEDARKLADVLASLADLSTKVTR